MDGYVWCVLWQMGAVGITENVKGDAKKFEIWYNGREEVYIIQVRGRIRHEKVFCYLNPQSGTIMFISGFFRHFSFVRVSVMQDLTFK